MKSSSEDVTGIVTSRVCPLCGHHEIGLATRDGGFFPLKPGMIIRIANGPEPSDSVDKFVLPDLAVDQKTLEYVLWVPEPAKPFKRLRLKYGLKLRPDQMAEGITPENYRMAYLDKLRELIEKEVYVPIPVILDRFFSAPQLATGDSKQAAEAMWRELEEVREPVRKVETWLISGDLSVFSEETREEDYKDSSAPQQPEEKLLLEELNNLTLENFLAML